MTLYIPVPPGLTPSNPRRVEPGASALHAPSLPDDWRALLNAGRRAGWEMGLQSRYGAAPCVYAWRCARTVGGGWFATGEGEMELGTVEMARGWLAEGCPAPATPIELWSMRRAA